MLSLRNPSQFWLFTCQILTIAINNIHEPRFNVTMFSMFIHIRKNEHRHHSQTKPKQKHKTVTRSSHLVLVWCKIWKSYATAFSGSLPMPKSFLDSMSSKTQTPDRRVFPMCFVCKYYGITVWVFEDKEIILCLQKPRHCLQKPRHHTGPRYACLVSGFLKTVFGFL